MPYFRKRIVAEVRRKAQRACVSCHTADRIWVERRCAKRSPCEWRRLRARRCTCCCARAHTLARRRAVRRALRDSLAAVCVNAAGQFADARMVSVEHTRRAPRVSGPCARAAVTGCAARSVSHLTRTRACGRRKRFWTTTHTPPPLLASSRPRAVRVRLASRRCTRAAAETRAAARSSTSQHGLAADGAQDAAAWRRRARWLSQRAPGHKRAPAVGAAAAAAQARPTTRVNCLIVVRSADAPGRARSISVPCIDAAAQLFPSRKPKLAGELAAQVRRRQCRFARGPRRDASLLPLLAWL
jgi:hypothetical protein